MRGGRFQEKERSSEDGGSMRNAEMLFQTRSIADIREVEARTRKDIEEKKEELRQLVGASYRDLIESADSILAMRRSCEAVLGHVSSMETRFSTLKASTGSAKLTPKADRARKRKEVLYSVSCRVKYLVDTPEKIWGCLDEHLYLEAAERYVRAREVHTLLAAQQDQHARGPAAPPGGLEDPAARSRSEILACFPLLRHQWPLVETFKQQISQRSYERLQHQGADVQEYAVALAATAVIDGLSCSQVLALFLETRRFWVRSLLRQASGSPAASQGGPGHEVPAPALGIPEALSRVVSVIQVSLCHAGQLFLDVASAGQRRPLFFATLLQTPPESQLFGGVPGPEAEIEAWKAHREALETQAGAGLPSAQVSDAVRQWMQACASDLIAEGKVLLDSVAHISSLARAEARIREAVADKGPLAGSLDWLAAAFGRAPEVPWDAACELLLREPLDLWGTLFEGLFTQRAKDIIDSAFLGVRVVEEVEALLADSRWERHQDAPRKQPLAGAPAFQGGAGQLAAEEEEAERGSEGWKAPLGPGSRRAQAWDAQQLLLEEFVGQQGAAVASLVADTSLARTACTPSSASSAAGGKGPFWDAAQLALTKSQSGDADDAARPGAIQQLSHKLVLGIRLRVDALLHTALQDALAYLVAAPDAALAASRTRDLAPCLQSAAYKCFSGILRGLEQQLQEACGPRAPAQAGASPPAASSVEGRRAAGPGPQVERALLIGRVCSALAKHSLWLPVVLGPPEDWAAAGLALALGPRPYSHPASPAPALLPHQHVAAGLDPASSPKGALPTCDGAALLEAISLRRKQRGSGGFSGRDSASAAFARRSTSSAGSEGAQSPQQTAARDTGRLRDILRGLRRLSVVSHEPWVEQTAGKLVSAFFLSLQSDEALSTSTPLKGWEETVVQQAGVDAKGSDVEMKMLLPAMPSSYALALLYCACASIHRTAAAGAADGPSGSLDPAVLQMLAWKLDSGVLESFEALVAETSGAPQGSGTDEGLPRFPALSEKGLLQLLFDLRFLSDALCGGQDVDPLALPELPSAPGDALLLADLSASGAGGGAALSLGGPSRYTADASPSCSSLGGRGARGSSKDAVAVAAAAAAQRKRRVSLALEALHERLDPIDWAAYEPYLWQNEQRFYLRSSVLLGSLVQLHRLYSDVNMRRQRQPYSRQTEANVLNTAAPAPRFVFLPISSPSAASSSSTPKKRPSVFGDKAGAAAAAAAVSAYGRLSADAPGAAASGGGVPGMGPLDPLAALGLAADSAGLTSAISGGATPLIRSLMGQVTLGSILADGGAQALVGRNISSLGDMLPSQAAGLFSSLVTAQSQGQGNPNGL